MNDAIVVLNAGSSSIKFSHYVAHGESLELDLRGQIEGLYTKARFVAKGPDGRVKAGKTWNEGVALDHAGALEYLVGFLQEAVADCRLVGVGHRVVHGGLEYSHPVRVDAGVLEVLDRFVPLAPLHQPNNLAPIRMLMERAPDLPQVACFDTAFHRTNPDLAQRFALPVELHDAGVRRYGFHGLSYEYVASVLPDIDLNAARGRCIVLHLGNGASMCAMSNGRSLASTMGFTAVDGLPMGTRCGSLDPGVIPYLIEQQGMDTQAVEDLIYNKSGLLGVSGLSSDMRTLLGSDQPRARLAIDLYVYRIGRELGSLAAALGGLDAIVFTAGIGEHAAPIRERVLQAARWLGVHIDGTANLTGGPRISSLGSAVSAWVVPTNEELMIARHTQALLGASHTQGE